MRPKQKRRNPDAVRVLRLWRYLEGRKRRPPIAALAREFNVTPRTIYRDLWCLEEAHCRVPPPLMRGAHADV